ncbi:GAF domain-containing protein [Aliikangiella sp. G2MR2-5]|uniref:GAF domain-containing protein n=1 Tax=Aliikangiella sp. G2MR2-5 TaxID=2788943 RepID=UPI0018AB1E2B|nr:GAF domain-containing protein [Aliikangiella sp. G2MR2-5]
MSANTSEFYRSLCLQLEGLLENERNWITNLSQFSALLNMNLDRINWVGFYLANSSGDLKLGPFQGNVACINIPLGKGVCGSAAESRKTIVVEDVDKFDGHIACDARSRSEVVCPLVKEGQLIGVLDIDSPEIGRFNDEDARGLETLVSLLIEMTDWPAN